MPYSFFFCDCLKLAEHLIFSGVADSDSEFQVNPDPGFDELKYKKLKFTYP